MSSPVTQAGFGVLLCGLISSCSVTPDPNGTSEVPSPVNPSAGPSTTEVHTVGGGGRPVSLNYKDDRERRALLGLTYEGGRVKIDPVEAPAMVTGIDPELAAIEFEKGRELIARNARLEAIAAHTRAVLLDPGEARMYEGLGDALRAERFESRAEAAYRTGLELGATSMLHIKLGEILWMGSDQEGALAEAERAVALDPGNGRATADLARWYYFTENYSEAWRYVHRSEALGAKIPAQFRPLLSSRMPEPRR